MKALKVTISGSYRDSKGEAVDFDNLTGVIPFVEEEIAKMHVRSRHAVMWIVGAKKGDTEDRKYPLRLDSLRQVFVDSIEPIKLKEPLSYVGKDIKEMSYEELQDLAVAKDLRRIPLPKEVSGVDLREMRAKAYMDYAAKVLGWDDTQKLPEDVRKHPPVEKRINPDTEGYNFAKLKPLIADGDIRIDNTKRLTNEEILELEANTTNLNDKPGSTLSLNDLKAIAKEKNITFHNTIGFDALYAKIYGSAA